MSSNQMSHYIPKCIRTLDLFSASECREWLIHYSVPVLYKILNATVFTHYLLLVTAMALLTKDGASHQDVSYADALLADFCKLFPSVYGMY